MHYPCVLVSVFLAAAFAIDLDEPPRATLSIKPDLAKGGSMFTLDLFNLNLNDSEDEDISLYVYRDGFSVFDDPYDDAIYTDCPLATTPGSNSIKNSCSFFLYAANVAGSYTAEIYVNSRDINLSAESVLANDIPNWWNKYTLVKKETSRFTGFTDLVIRYDSVPPEVNTLELSYWTDTDYDGYPDRPQGAILCSLVGGIGGMHQFLCEKDRIPPLCTQDDFGNSFCDDGSDHAYYFYANNIQTSFSYQAILYRLSRYEEGQFFGRTNFDNGMPLQDFFNLDTFRYQSPESCSYQNDRFCYELGYYDTWVSLYLHGFDNLMASDGSFEAEAAAGGIDVSAKIPLLPIGANGFRATVSCVNINDASSKAEMDLVCGESGCDTASIRLPSGTYRVSLKIYNNHPAIRVYDFDGNEIVFGQTLEKSYPLGDTITLKTSVSPLKVSKIMLQANPVIAGESVVAKFAITEPGSGGNFMATFNWGGGIKSAVTVGPSDSGMAVSQHVYNSVGIYKVRATISNDEGESDSTPGALVFVVAGNGKKVRSTVQAGDLFLVTKLVRDAPGNYSGVVRARIKGKYYLRFESTNIDRVMFLDNWAFVAGRGFTRKGLEVGWEISLLDGDLTSNGQDLVRLVIFKSGKRSKVLYDSQPKSGRYTKPTRQLTKGNIALKFS